MSRQDWLAWRLKGIGSSDAPVVMGVSPWMTPLELWKVKTGRVVEDAEPNFAMKRGIELEPKARAHYELLRDLDMPAQCFEHPVHCFLRASLDGWNREARRILEIKYIGAADKALALRTDLSSWERVPEKYRWQLVHQFMVSDAKQADYYAFDGETGVLVEVERDLAKEQILFQAEEAFWQLVKSDTPPPLTARDYLELSDPHAVALCEMWKESRALGMKKQMEEIREEMRRYLIHPRVECAGVRLMEVQRTNGKTFEVRLAEKEKVQ